MSIIHLMFFLCLYYCWFSVQIVKNNQKIVENKKKNKTIKYIKSKLFN